MPGGEVRLWGFEEGRGVMQIRVLRSRDFNQGIAPRPRVGRGSRDPWVHGHLTVFGLGRPGLREREKERVGEREKERERE